MAGIGFALRDVFEEGPLLGPLRAFALAALVSAGPGLGSSLAVAVVDALSLLGHASSDERRFLAIVTAAFAYSLVVLAPWQLVATRLLADRLMDERADAAAADLWRLLPAALALQLVLGAAFLACVPLGGVVRLEALLLFQLNGGIWLALTYVSATRRYGVLAIALLAGLAIGVGSAVLGGRWGLVGQLGGFTAGQAVVLLALLVGVARVFGAPKAQEPLRQALWRYRWLAIAGLCYGVGLWVDKWLFWMHGATGTAIAGPLRASPVYDDAMFLATLTTVPGLALFLLRAETEFNTQFRTYFATIAGQRGWNAIQRARARMLEALRDGLGLVLKVQGTITALVVLYAPQLCRTLGVHWFSVPVFRAGALAACLQLFLGIGFTLLLYFDWQRAAALAAFGFALANAAGTWVCFGLGLGAYGYGCLLGSAAALVLTYALLERGLDELEFHVFMRPLPSLARRAGAVLVALGLFASPARAAVPRDVTLLYDGARFAAPDAPGPARAIATVLAYEGQRVHACDARGPLPNAARVVALLDTQSAHPRRLAAWLATRERLVIVGAPGFLVDAADAAPTPPEVWRPVFERLGLSFDGISDSNAGALALVSGEGYERAWRSPHVFYGTHSHDPQNSVFLRVRRGADLADLGVVGPRGGAVWGLDNALHANPLTGHLQWRVDPFRFFTAALGLDGAPRPDVTTLNGRRVFYAEALDVEPGARAWLPGRPPVAALFARLLKQSPLPTALRRGAAASAIAAWEVSACPSVSDFAPWLLWSGTRLVGAGLPCDPRWLDGLPFGSVASWRALVRASARPRLEPVVLRYRWSALAHLAGLRTLEACYREAAEAPWAPITSAEAADMRAGFATMGVTQTGPACWRVSRAGACRTVRFDHERRVPDLAACAGVAGYARDADTLYVSLASSAATIALALAPARVPHLHDANAVLRDWRLQGQTLHASFESRMPLRAALAGFEPRERVRVGTRWCRADARGQLSLDGPTGRSAWEVCW